MYMRPVSALEVCRHYLIFLHRNKGPLSASLFEAGAAAPVSTLVAEPRFCKLRLTDPGSMRLVLSTGNLRVTLPFLFRLGYAPAYPFLFRGSSLLPLPLSFFINSFARFTFPVPLCRCP